MATGPQKFEQYRSGSSDNLSTRELKFGEWWTRRKHGFRTLLIVLLLFVGVGGIGTGLYTIGKYIFVDRAQDARETKQLLHEKISFPSYHDSLAPAEPEFLGVDVLPATQDRYDFVTFATNPNEDWFMTFTYTFQFDERETEPLEAMLVPGEKTVVAYLGYKSAQRPGSAIINVKEVRWHRISAHEVPNPLPFIAQHTDIDIRDVQFIPGVSGGDVQDPSVIKAHRALFTAENKTAYNFRSLPVYIVFSRGAAIQSIERTEIGEFKTGETRAIEVRSLKANIDATTIEVLPYIAVFDPDIYSPQ